MSNMLIYVYQICPSTPQCSGPGKLSSVGGESGRGSQGRKEIPSSSEASGRGGWSLQQMLLSEVLWRKVAWRTSVPFLRWREETIRSEIWVSWGNVSTLAAPASVGLWTGLRVTLWRGHLLRSTWVWEKKISLEVSDLDFLTARTFKFN